jgi:hypothetical protein
VSPILSRDKEIIPMCLQIETMCLLCYHMYHKYGFCLVISCNTNTITVCHAFLCDRNTISVSLVSVSAASTVLSHWPHTWFLCFCWVITWDIYMVSLCLLCYHVGHNYGFCICCVITWDTTWLLCVFCVITWDTT